MSRLSRAATLGGLCARLAGIRGHLPDHSGQYRSEQTGGFSSRQRDRCVYHILRSAARRGWTGIVATSSIG